MKTILSTILLLLTCGASAQTYSYRPTPFSDTFVRTIVNAAQARSYFGITYDTTNSPTLSGTNVFAGTNTFVPTKFYPANMIGMRVLWSSPSNIFLPTITVNATGNATNNGDYANTTHVGIGTIPPLLSSNSMLLIYGAAVRSNANSSTATLNAFIGSNTNFIGTFAAFNLALGNGQINGSSLIMPGGGPSLWVQGANFATPQIYGPQAFFDSTVSNTIYFGSTTTTGHTNLQVYGLRVVELFAP